jgi:hypothetical protein
MTPSSSPDIASDPVLSAASQEALETLLASGWTALYSTTCRAWWLRQAAWGWVTNVYTDPNAAIAAAASVEARAEAATAERARLKEALRKELHT